MAKLTYEELYKRQMEIEKARDPEVVFLVDTTEEDTNWLRDEEDK